MRGLTANWVQLHNRNLCPFCVMSRNDTEMTATAIISEAVLVNNIHAYSTASEDPLFAKSSACDTARVLPAASDDFEPKVRSDAGRLPGAQSPKP